MQAFRHKRERQPPYPYDCNPHKQESPHPRAPKSPKSLKKDFPGLPARSVKKVSKKPPSADFAVFLTLFRVIWDFFDTFFATPGREALEVLFQTFWGFRGSGVWRLLLVGIAIAILSLIQAFYGQQQKGMSPHRKRGCPKGISGLEGLTFGWPQQSPVFGPPQQLEVDKRAPTNVQNVLVFSFLLSLILLRKSLILRESPGGTSLEKCEKVWRSVRKCRNDFAL